MHEKKVEAAAGKHVHWQLPYLPLDPQDIGRTYEAIIRVNSQSGKGGSAWVILRNLELDLPRGLQVAFSKVVQQRAEVKGQELTNEELCDLFKQEYYIDYEGDNFNDQTYKLIDYSILTPAKGQKEIEAEIQIDDKIVKIKGQGNGQLSAFNAALSKHLNIDLNVKHYHEHSLGVDSNSRAATYIEVSLKNDNVTRWGVGIHEDVSQASFFLISHLHLERLAQKQGYLDILVSLTILFIQVLLLRHLFSSPKKNYDDYLTRWVDYYKYVIVEPVENL